MEVRLRASWDRCVKEETKAYSAKEDGYFLHESLDVYQRSLEVHEALGAIFHGNRARGRYARRIDSLTTSLTVNIAEGNGRFSKLDHSKFVTIAENAGTKLAAYLDLIAPMALVDIDRTKSLLREVMAMLSGLQAYLAE